jgi:hypothetical protein
VVCHREGGRITSRRARWVGLRTPGVRKRLVVALSVTTIWFVGFVADAWADVNPSEGIPTEETGASDGAPAESSDSSTPVTEPDPATDPDASAPPVEPSPAPEPTTPVTEPDPVTDPGASAPPVEPSPAPEPTTPVIEPPAPTVPLPEPVPPSPVAPEPQPGAGPVSPPAEGHGISDAPPGSPALPPYDSTFALLRSDADSAPDSAPTRTAGDSDAGGPAPVAPDPLRFPEQHAPPAPASSAPAGAGGGFGSSPVGALAALIGLLAFAPCLSSVLRERLASQRPADLAFHLTRPG